MINIPNVDFERGQMTFESVQVYYYLLLALSHHPRRVFKCIEIFFYFL